MLSAKKKIERCLRYPLMLGMLLWALTLPGHEVQVYSFLFHGTPSQSVFKLVSAHDKEGQIAVQQQAVEVFEDAEASSFLVLDIQQLVKHPLLLLAFAAPADEPLLTCTTNSAEFNLSTLQLQAAIQPNAP